MHLLPTTPGPAVRAHLMAPAKVETGAVWLLSWVGLGTSGSASERLQARGRDRELALSCAALPAICRARLPWLLLPLQRCASSLLARRDGSPLRAPRGLEVPH